jgi:DNA-binding PadR family transcriptional regulator
LHNENFLDKDMRSSMLKMFVLRRVSRESANPYTLMKEFAKRRRFRSRFIGRADAKNEIYNTISSLERSGYIKSSQKTENGRLKNYYSLTAKGRKVMASARVLFKRHIKALTTLLNK